MEVSDLETYFLPLIASMTMNNKYAKRWSVCYLLTTVYMRVSPKYQSKYLVNLEATTNVYIMIVLL